MEFPKRVAQHITETKSFKTFNANVPDNWIVREVTERDYGIDCYIEIVNENNELKGDTVLVQLKGIDSGVNWTVANYYTLSGINITTTNYWNNFLIPVFIFLTDTQKQEVYFQPVKSTIRQSYNTYIKQLGFSYKIQKSNKITKSEYAKFLETYKREKSIKTVEDNIISLISNYEKYEEYYEQYSSRDPFLGLEDSRILYLQNYYRNIKILCEHFDIDWDLKSFEEYQKESMSIFGDDYYTLHELVNDKILESLRLKINPIFLKIRDLITSTEKEYWMTYNLTLFNEVNKIEDDGSYRNYWD